MPTPEEMEKILQECHEGLVYLLGNPKYPDRTGAIVRVEEHLTTLNGRLLLLDNQVGNNSSDIKVMQDRWNWARWLIGTGIAGGLAGLWSWVKSMWGQ